MKIKAETPETQLFNESPHSQTIVANNFIFTQGVICLTPYEPMVEGTLEEQVKPMKLIWLL